VSKEIRPPTAFKPSTAEPRPFGVYLGRPWWNFAMCALRLWNFFAVAVLHAPIESPWR
jgi:hypothetical protein